MSTNKQQAVDTGNSAEAGRLLAEAKVHAINEYNASEGAQLMLESEKQLIENVRADTALKENYWNAGYELGQEFSKGKQAGVVSGRSGMEIVGEMNLSRGGFSHAHAYGLNYVPYNGYPAVLHEGERVLTASENRSYGQNAGGNINITGNTFTVREEADIDKIASALLNKIVEADLSYAG